MSKTIITKMYPLTKFFGFCLIATICLSLPTSSGKVFSGTALFLIINGLARNLVPFFRKLLKIMLLLSLTIFLINGLFHQSTEVAFSIGFLDFKQEGVLLALNFIANMYVILGFIMTFFDTTSMADFIVSLERAHLPFSVAYTILSTFQIIPDLGRRSRVIMEAQNARGIETEGSLRLRVKAFVPMVSPLIISSITELNEKVITLEARGFSAGIPRTSISTLKTKKSDYLFLFICATAVCCFYVGKEWLL